VLSYCNFYVKAVFTLFIMYSKKPALYLYIWPLV